MTDGFYIPDGNEALRDDIPAVVELIERTARWVNPETFRRLPVWAHRTPLADDRSTMRDGRAAIPTPERRPGSPQRSSKATSLRSKHWWRPSTWRRPSPRIGPSATIWGYDDPSFAQQSSVVQDPRYFSCVANMVWLPTPLKGFTDTLPEIKAMLRVCAFHLYGWACEHPRSPSRPPK